MISASTLLTKLRLIAGIAFTSALLSACDAAQMQSPETGEQEIGNSVALSNDIQEVKPQKATIIKLKGQILFQEMEGGFFGFIDENGKKYTPVGIQKDHLRHGLVIELTGELMPNMITITQFGEVVKVHSVVVLDESKALEAGRPKPRSSDI